MTLRKKLATSGAWTVLASLLNGLSSFVVFAILARLLTPSEFGVVAFATIFIEVGRTLVVAGISDALVKHSEWDQLVATTGFWINLFAGLILAVLLVLGSAAMVGEDYDRQFQLVLAVLSLDLIVEGFTAVHVAKLRREFRYRELATNGIATRLVSAVVGVTMAFAGAGVWALVASRLTASLGLSIILWNLSGFRPNFQFSSEHARRMTPFAANQLGSQLLAQLNGQAGALVVGAFLGPSAIAQYRVGARALNMITSIVISPLQQTALSGFARIHDREVGGSVATAYQRMTRITALVACPTFFGVAAIAPDLVELLFGPNWDQASDVLFILCIFVGPAVIGYFHGPALSGAGKANLSFLSAFVGAVGNFIFALVAAPFGLTWVAISQVVRPHLSLPLNLFFLKVGINADYLKILRDVIPPYFCSAAMFFFVLACRTMVLGDLHLIYRIAICIICGGIFYLYAMRLIAREFWRATVGEVLPLLPVSLRNHVRRLADIKDA